MIVSERPEPVVSAPGSLLSFWRRSEPSTRMLLAEVSGKPAGSSTLATFDGSDVRSKCELTRNSTSDSASQPSTSASRGSARCAWASPSAASRARWPPRARTRPRPPGRARRGAPAAAPPGAARPRARRQPRAGAVAGVPRGLVAVVGHRDRTLYLRDDPTEAPVGRLVVCPTPIGNLEDVTLRVLATLRAADVVACEDTRHTRRAARPPRHRRAAGEPPRAQRTRSRARSSWRASATARWWRWCPTRARRWCPTRASRSCASAWRAGVALEVLPGPSAVLTALVASGLPAERWRFVGFLPRKRGRARAAAASAPRRRSSRSSRRGAWPPRSRSWPSATRERPLAVCRELTKLHEEVRRGTAAELAEHYREKPRARRGGAGRRRGPRPGGRSARGAVGGAGELVDAGARARAAAGGRRQADRGAAPTSCTGSSRTRPEAALDTCRRPAPAHHPGRPLIRLGDESDRPPVAWEQPCPST